MSSHLFIVSITGSNTHTHTKSDGGTPADTHARAAGVKQPGSSQVTGTSGILNGLEKTERERETGEGPEGSSLYIVRDRGKQSIWPPPSSPRGHFLIAPVPNLPDDEGA